MANKSGSLNLFGTIWGVMTEGTKIRVGDRFIKVSHNIF